MNEKYYGDMLLQKTFTTDTLPFKRKRNGDKNNATTSPTTMNPLFQKSRPQRVREIMEQRKTEKAMVDTDTRKYNQR
jgi:hypothetical protein